MKKSRAFLISLLLVVGVLLVTQFPKQQPARQESFATNIIDGDTIVINGGERVRLLGIDTPERGEFYYSEGKKRLEELIDKKQIFLESEGDNKDTYGRLLRYVFLNDTNVNMVLVAEGYAICYFYDANTYRQICAGLEEQARKEGKGIWQKQEAVKS